MRRKKFLNCAVLCLLLVFCACSNEYAIDWNEYLGVSGIGEESEAPASTLAPTFDYTWEPSKYLVGGTAGVDVFPTPRGIFIGAKHGLKCYSPATGIVSTACGDPLCPHEIFSDCAFSDYTEWNPYPISDGDFFYYIHHPSKEDWKYYQLVKCDLYGMELTVLYETENLLHRLFLVERSLYFMEEGAEQGAQLYRYDLDTGACKSPNVNSDEGLITQGFIPVGNAIYYVFDGALYKSNLGLTDVDKVLDDFAYQELYTDGRNLFYVAHNKGIYKTDLTNFQTKLVYEIPEGLLISHHQLADGGISFLLLDFEKRAWSSADFDAWIAQYPENSIYFYQFEEDTCLEIKLGNFYTINYSIYDGKLFMEEYLKDSTNRGVGGHWYLSDIHAVEPILLFEDRVRW